MSTVIDSKKTNVNEKENVKMKKTTYDKLSDVISSTDLISEADKQEILTELLQRKEEEINLLLVGSTGAGKSSTINAMFGEEIAKVGVGVDPETMDIQRYKLGNLILWDSPGFGDGKEEDNDHAKSIIKKLNEIDKNGNPLIDLVVVILDGSAKDLGTVIELTNNVIIPNLGNEWQKRILIAINQADMAMKGRNWDSVHNCPNEELLEFLEKKAESVKRRIYENTGVNIEPIYYSAGYKDGDKQQNPYNLSKLFSYILRMTPKQKRLAYCDNINRNKEMWKSNDALKDYSKEIRSSFMETIEEFADKGSDIGRNIGSVFGGVGKFIGGAIGKVVGGLLGAVFSIFD